MIQEKKRMRVLAVDNDKTFLNAFRRLLEYNEFTVDTISNPLTVMEHLSAHKTDCIVLDVKMPGMDGMELLNKIIERYPFVPVIMLSGESTISIAMDAIKKGAYDFVEKQSDSKRLLVAVQNALDKRNWIIEKSNLKQEIAEKYKILGSSKAIKKVLYDISKLAPTNAKVLIQGESGTGKELVAGALHYQSLRSGNRYIKQNCAAIPGELLESQLFGYKKGAFTGAHTNFKGKFLMADGGTLFLDEIGDMPLNLQAKLLRVLQEGEVEVLGSSDIIKTDTRIISATNKNLTELIGQGRFRQDLYHRLNVFTINIPPLRDRTEDISILARYFLNQYAERYNKPLLDFSPQVILFMEEQKWPGNVRELQNFIHRIALFANQNIITMNDVLKSGLQFPDENVPKKLTGLKEVMHYYEKKYIMETLEQNNGRIQETADMLCIERTTLFKKMRKYGLKG